MKTIRAAALLLTLASVGALAPAGAAGQTGAPAADPASQRTALSALPLPAVAAPSALVEVDASQPVEPAPRIPLRRFAAAPLVAERVAAPAQARDRSGVPLIIAGAALFVAGAMIDGDAGTLLMVSGAAIGAYGLYVYF